jgi:phosphopantetheinyl transferase (holo-ACP synthase)
MSDFQLLRETVEIEMAGALNLEGLRCQLSEAFSSKVPEHRDKIRGALKGSISSNSRGNSTESLDSLLDLQLLPRLYLEAISISHCPSLGGFVHLAKNDSFLGIGFDIEIANRVSVAVARKVLPHSSELFLHTLLESEDSSIPACIWAAKESAIKSIGNALSDRQIFSGNLALTKFASANDSLCFHFRAGLTDNFTPMSAESLIGARGIVRKTDQWILALAISYSLPTKLEQ